ncbi:DNA polymerase-3 subunit delta' [Inhella inkyongensis]|uniref:DNA polymerase-3 subunit delta n=1 Tax=Inhella inkyongensis TaxID=392593 RepID=A0A840S2M2_9BURK|nr:DNA polymerase III subunit delta' [Inhella inkyongensis]MBB5205447.1 DNA polymerase-3 subunit delta' [Inhella inkyongensis]
MAPLPDFLQGALQQALSLGKTHAVLITGQAGLGQFELARALSQAWLCEDHAPGTPACGHCASCHLVAQRSHPDERWLLPAALRVQLGFEEAPAEGKAKPSKEIRIDEVRAMLDFSISTSGRGQGKVVGIHPAEALNTVAANALLKTLEEPGGALRFVLSCAAPDELLPTIRSRCQVLQLEAPSAAQATQWLAHQGLPAADAQTLLSLSAGRPGQALSWHSAGLNTQRLAALVTDAQQGDLSAHEALGLPTLIDLLARLAHDQLRRAHGQAALYFDGASLPPPAKAEALQRWAQELRQARAKGEHPLTPGLWLDTLAAQAQAGLRPAKG